jgi:hypothetical protein
VVEDKSVLDSREVSQRFAFGELQTTYGLASHDSIILLLSRILSDILPRDEDDLQADDDIISSEIIFISSSELLAISLIRGTGTQVAMQGTIQPSALQPFILLQLRAEVFLFFAIRWS